MIYFFLLVLGGIVNTMIFRRKVGDQKGVFAAFIMGALIYGGIASALVAIFG